MKKFWLKKCDLLNVPTSLSYKNEYFYSTNFGSILTILFTFIILFITTYQIIILCKKTSFTLKSNQYTDLSQIVDFSKTPILFELTNDNGQSIELDNKLFMIEAFSSEMAMIIYENGTIQRKFSNTKLELENCNKIYSNQTEYSMLNLSRYICFKPDQNLTTFGLVGDINYPFKGIRLYINRCSGADCYDTNEIIKKLNNVKFIVSYLSLSSNMFHLKNENIKYQLYSKYFSLSTNILKKIIFTYDIGRFYLYNNVAFKNEISLDYILGNDYTIDFDLDPSSTNLNNLYTLSSISFNYGGKVIETRKEVQTLFESISIIGNYFNMILTLFKVINTYYTNKILFVDIFKTFFFCIENISINNFKNKQNIFLKKNIYLNKNKSFDKKSNLDLSEEIFNENINKNNNRSKQSMKSQNKQFIIENGSKSINKRKPESYDTIKENITKNKLIYYYLFPFWILKRIKKLSSIYVIKGIICSYFSIEKMNELIKFKEIIENQSIKMIDSNTELIKINNNNFGNKDSINKENI